MSAGQVCSLMNRFGADRCPCVWGFDYALKRGFFLATPSDTSDILWQVEGIGNVPVVPSDTRQLSLAIVKAPTWEEYASAFSTVRSGLMRGDSFLANLTAASEVEVDASLEEIFYNSPARFKFKIGEEFVCFSPEPFVCIEANRISTFPMKGTARGDTQEALDTLINDYKEQCEHATVVDLLRNDLSSVAFAVKVQRYRYAEAVTTRRGTLWQTSSEITGNLPADWQSHIGDIITTMLPAGSICGAPKQSTLRLIDRVETCRRGWYTGVAGYFDGETLKSGVMIRCLQRGEDGRLRFHSGGGITVNSDCRAEYNELIEKIYLPCSSKQ